jgi:hypothetical protein
MYRIEEQPDSLEFMPMSWYGYSDSNIMKTVVDTLVLPQIKSGLARRFLGFNEPDHPGQASMEVAEALDRWPVLETLGVPLVSPSCAWPEREWMEQFMGNATERCLRVDYLGVHWYGRANFTVFAKYMEDLYEKYQLPMLITEFAPADYSAKRMTENPFSPAEVLEFMKEALPWLEQQDYITGYAWFSFTPTNPAGWSSSLFDTDGNLTAIGRFYKSVTNDNIYGDQSIEPDYVSYW